jgi:hypothetical protein
MEEGYWLLCLQEPVTGPYPEPDEFSPLPSCLFKIQINIFIGLLSGHFVPGLNQNVCSSYLSHVCYRPRPFHPPWLDHNEWHNTAYSYIYKQSS